MKTSLQIVIPVLNEELTLSISVNKLYKSISSTLAIPVEIIIGLFFFATYLINGMSVISKEAILYIGQSNSSNKLVVPIIFVVSVLVGVRKLASGKLCEAK